MGDTALNREDLITLTSDIVAAHISNNAVAATDIPPLIQNVFGALAALRTLTVAEAPRPDPAVSVRASVKPDHVVCLDCGKKMKMLKRHVATEHGLTSEEYRQRWGLNHDYPMVAPNYAATRAELARKIGLGRKPKATATNAPARAKRAASKPKTATARKTRAKAASA